MKRAHIVLFFTIATLAFTARSASQDTKAVAASEAELTAKIKAANAILWEMKNLCARLAGQCGGLQALFARVWDAKSVANKADAALKAHQDVFDIVSKCAGCSDTYKLRAEQSLKNSITWLNEYREAIRNRDWAKCSSGTCS